VPWPGLGACVSESRSTFVSRTRPSFGAWCVIPSGFTAQIFVDAGVDWMCVDMQHGLIGYTEMREIVQAVKFSGVPVLVRVSANTGGEIMRALDAGADGVIVPMVNSVVEAESAVAACRYPPLGVRSWGPSGASIGQSAFTTEAANRDVVCLVMIETRVGLAHADAIAAVAGLDGIYVGPNDLGLSLGLAPMLIDHGPVLTEAISTIAEACLRHGVVAGVAVYEPNAAAAVEKWQTCGFTLFGLPSDSLLLRRAADGLIGSLPSRQPAQTKTD
jgi:4-hydroxy-2-oxoheptanedioate aldolase